MINWHTEPRSRRLIKALDKSRVERVTRIAVPCDYSIFVGADRAAQRKLYALEARRDRAIARAVGGSFAELEARGEALRYLDAMDLAPTVYDVLAEAHSAQVAA